MSIVGLLASLLLALIAIAIVARPLFSSRRGRNPSQDSRQLQREQLQDYYEAGFDEYPRPGRRLLDWQDQR